MRINVTLIGALFLSQTHLVVAANDSVAPYQRECSVVDGVVVCRSLADELAALPADEKGTVIYREADKQHGPLMGYGSPGYGDSQSRFTAYTKDITGEVNVRELRLKYLEDAPDGNKRLIIIDKPKDLKRHAMLTVSHKDGSDEQWVYDPDNKQVKRILSNNAFTPFYGTEITFEDISSQDVGKYDYQFLRDDRYDGTACHVVNRFPKDKYSGYSRLETWIDKSTYLIKKIDFYDRKNALLKTLRLDKYQQYNGKYWRAGEMLVENHQSGRSTQLIWSEFQFNTGLTAEDFSLNSLRNVN